MYKPPHELCVRLFWLLILSQIGSKDCIVVIYASSDVLQGFASF